MPLSKSQNWGNMLTAKNEKSRLVSGPSILTYLEFTYSLG